jgi:ubiquinone/menaquinone biosynthesis C-methylase UbiE
MLREDGGAEVVRSYAPVAKRYERRWRRYLEETIGATLDALRPVPGERILDVGCGTGLLLARLAERQRGVEAAGLDLTEAMLRVARVDHGADRLVRGDSAALPFAAGSLDAVVSSSSLHHWTDVTAALREMRRVVHPRGRVVITDWSRDPWYFRPLARLHLRSPAVRQVLTLAQLVEALRSAGLVVTGSRVYRAAGWWGMMTLVAIPDEPRAGA